MRLRNASSSDADALADFDLGDDATPWLAEVREIVNGLLGWRDDPEAMQEDRRVVVADVDGEIVAVAAHSLFVDTTGRAYPASRYLMVTAVRIDQQRSSIGQTLVESLLVDLRNRGCETVEWLVAPGNHASIAFSRSRFPEAEESQPADVAPYVQFLLRL